VLKADESLGREDIKEWVPVNQYKGTLVLIEVPEKGPGVRWRRVRGKGKQAKKENNTLNRNSHFKEI